MAHHDSPASTQEARGAQRRAVEAPVRLRIETTDIHGTSDNLSSAGLLFFTNEPLRVTVEVEEEGGIRTHAGRLLRVQSMGATSTGLAIEFDPS